MHHLRKKTQWTCFSSLPTSSVFKIWEQDHVMTSPSLCLDKAKKPGIGFEAQVHLSLQGNGTSISWCIPIIFLPSPWYRWVPASAWHSSLGHRSGWDPSRLPWRSSQRFWHLLKPTFLPWRADNCSQSLDPKCHWNWMSMPTYTCIVFKLK